MPKIIVISDIYC